MNSLFLGPSSAASCSVCAELRTDSVSGWLVGGGGGGVVAGLGGS
jgi:hypothetical protein